VSDSMLDAPDTGSIPAYPVHTFRIMETTRRSAAYAQLRDFGHRVKVLRVQRDLTQEQLALAAGFGPWSGTSRERSGTWGSRRTSGR